MSINEILHAHGYHEGAEDERLMLVLKDLARERAVLAVYKLLNPHLQTMGIEHLVDG